MAVWIYAYGHIRVPDEEIESPAFLDRLNAVTFDELTFLESVRRKSAPGAFALEHYESSRASLICRFNDMSDADFNACLDAIKYPRVTRPEVIDLFIARAEKHEREEDELFQKAWEKSATGVRSLWQHPDRNHFKNDIHHHNWHGQGIDLWLRNDLVRITGTSHVFSNYGTFLHSLSNETREFYHDYFKRILGVFKSDFILYAHEWSGMDDEDNDAFDLAELRESSNWEETSSDAIHTMDKFYYEKI